MRKQTVTSFVGTFCKPEMWHVYNQVHGLTRYRSLVLTRDRRNETMFPHGGVHTPYFYREPFKTRFRRRYLDQKTRNLYIKTIAALAFQLDGLQTDLLHIYFGHEATRLAPLLNLWEKPAVVSFHGADLGNYVRRANDRQWLPTVFAKCRLILARCEYFRSHLEELGCPPEKIRINRTHVLVDYFEEIERPTPADGSWNLLQACRFIPKKGLLVTIRAFARFAQRYPKASLYLAGDGPQLPAMQREIWKLGLTRQVFLTGFLDREALRALYGQCHFFLHPSSTDGANDIEGIPNALLEAMSTGLPSLSTAHAGIPEAIQDGENGYLVAHDDSEALGDRLLAMADDEALRSRLAHRAAESIREVYRPERQIHALEEIYAEAMS